MSREKLSTRKANYYKKREKMSRVWITYPQIDVAVCGITILYLIIKLNSSNISSFVYFTLAFITLVCFSNKYNTWIYDVNVGKKNKLTEDFVLTVNVCEEGSIQMKLGILFYVTPKWGVLLLATYIETNTHNIKGTWF